MAGLLWATAGCAEAPPTVAWTALVDGAQWVELTPDPYGAHRGPLTACHPDGWSPTDEFGLERDVLEVHTGLCPHFTGTRPAAAAVSAGDRLKVRIWHFDLSAPEPAQAHLAIRIAGEEVWTATVPIPSEAGLLEAEVRPSVDAPVGAPVDFHVRNHGANAWSLLELSAGR